ncbi:mobilome CxxCx(11)CxxC protein [Mucilaginibacter sp. cycad4]|uniref:mobilome CxxCx(11)CxxC protein n=1 Tax=Mucilaginibacter sp. cycad4 TaxID=3342096 RepID=UPI002AAA8845|nr:mobilome CxxCx(11)CxxC protein [Mucilaginibacter gossypii]WPU99326.1 mobilome CxxCx(11)CxxC protein [Mucilaginibacter gossypii]
MTDLELYDAIRLECHDKAFHCFGYSYIFEKRANLFRKVVYLIKALGILVPALIGATVLGYGIHNSTLIWIVYIAIPVMIIQFIFSLITILYKWDDELSYAYEAKVSYDNLYSKYKKLGKTPPLKYLDLKREYDLIELEKTLRNQQDSQHGIKDWELRRGMRYSLREHKEKCHGCEIMPLSIISTDCYVCGNFSLKYQTYKS